MRSWHNSDVDTFIKRINVTMSMIISPSSAIQTFNLWATVLPHTNMYLLRCPIFWEVKQCHNPQNIDLKCTAVKANKFAICTFFFCCKDYFLTFKDKGSAKQNMQAHTSVHLLLCFCFMNSFHRTVHINKSRNKCIILETWNSQNMRQ